MITVRHPLKSRILHKIEMGVLFNAYYDTEMTDLDKRFSEITQFGGVITDLGGNILHIADLRARVPPYAVFSAYAWLVQRMRKDDLNRGDPAAIFMGKVKRFFEYSKRIETAPYKENFLRSCTYGTYTDENGKKVGYYSYPVLNDDGSIDNDFIRIHENLRKFYFKHPKSGQWVKRDIKSMAIGYNNVNADDQWIWTAAHMAGADNIFFTHLAEDGIYRLDMLRVIEAAVVAGQAGENRLVVPYHIQDKTGERAARFSLGSILEANTRLASELRGITDGIEQTDGTQIDLTQLHGATADALALCALTEYVGKIHPDILSQMERNADWKHVIDCLSDVKSGFGNNAPVAYVDKNYPSIDGKFISLIGTDQYRNAPKVAVVWNLSIDPQSYTYNGKKIEDLTVADWKNILIHGRNHPNAPLKIIRAHKTPRLLDEATGYRSGFNLGLTRTDLHSRIQEIKKARIEAKVMMALRAAYPRLQGPDRLVLPQPEEELFTFSTLELFDAKLGEDVQVHHRVQNKVEEIAQKSRAHIMKVKQLWLKAVFFDEDIFLQDEGSVDGFLKKVKSINKDLERYQAVKLPEPDVKVCDKVTALHYKIKILFFARNYFAQGYLKDIGHHFWFEDNEGIRYSDTDVLKWPQHQIDEALRTGNLNVCHEVVNTTPLILDRIIEQLGFSDVLGDSIKTQLEAYKQLRLNGLPHNFGVRDRWLTVASARRDLEKVKNNGVVKEDLVAQENILPGAWEIFMERSHDSLSSLQDYEEYLNSLAIRGMTPDELKLVGIDPETLYPIPNFEYLVRKDTQVIDIPDRYIENPTLDPVRNRPIWVLPLSLAFNQNSGTPHDVLFRGQSLKKIFHLSGVRRVPMLPYSEANRDFYKNVANTYHASGLQLPPIEECIALIGNGPYPVVNWRPLSKINQSINLPKDWFEGILSPSLAGFSHAPSGYLFRDDNLDVKCGPTTLREFADGQSTGWQYDVEIIDAKLVSLADIRNMSIQQLQIYGFPSHDAAIDAFSSLFTKQKSNPEDSKNKAWAIAFGNINPESPEMGMMYYKPDAPVISYFTQSQFYEGPR
jgi:hypothetical protein